MMFGLAGMTLVKEFDRDKMESFVGALVCGFVTGWVIYKMFQGMKKLEDQLISLVASMLGPVIIIIFAYHIGRPRWKWGARWKWKLK